MRFGICIDPMHIEMAQEVGFAYVECNLSALGEMNETDFQRVKETVHKQEISCECANGMLRGDLRITGKQADMQGALNALRHSFARAAQLGVVMVSLGSSGARRVPQGFSKERALSQLIEFCRMAGDVAMQNGIRIALEPLCQEEDNLVNTVGDGLAMARRIYHPAIGLLCDWYHVCKNNESALAIGDAGPLLWHTHIASPRSRRFPQSSDGAQASYDAFFLALGDAGYTGRVSIEGKGDLALEGEIALAEMYRALKEGGEKP